ncbi:yjeF C-terminal region, hydroxyethylthiazole kinase-related [Brevibacterium sandarakinum]|uniref:ADP-dependent (S)-NAD(P)H-hydrate dehydratase n=1 Tax=Brevibacterium sandarakinum TaxID=629680 RepID=A0A1H1VH27_BRESA|nr:NAD(P)H-hydrate dehydratase [Brevibacterium sandarakinum]SDS83995.1 yjeF C-terminal region, hydroxyethylthiazole kinase-related [Brevibacterium sandarakinum]
MSVFAYPSTVIREAERPLLEAGVDLMARAARALAQFSTDVLRERRGQIVGSRVCVLAGPGNNAGDALFAAAALARRGAHITVVTLFESTHDEGLAAVRRAGATVIGFPSPHETADSSAEAAAGGTPDEVRACLRADILRELSRSDLVLDGILGIGGRPGLPEHIASLIRDWRHSASTNRTTNTSRTTRTASTPTVIAVDVPSDLSSDAAGAEDRIHADHTVTFGGLKTELIDPRVTAFTGTVQLVDIGLELDENQATAEVVDTDDLNADFPRPQPEGHKYSRGVVGILAGSEEYPGAGVLTTTSAVNCGVGMVRSLGSQLVSEYVLGLHAEVVTASGRMNAVVMGPGNPEDEYVHARVDELADTNVPVVLDAGALDMVGRAESVKGTWLAERPVVLTPHAGELARLLSRLLGEIITSSRINADPIGWAQRAAHSSGCIVLLKGHQTVIAAPDGFCVLPEAGPASLATAGSGDVLAGIIGALVATVHAGTQHEAPLPERELAHTVGLGVLVHNAAGRRAVNAGALVDAVAEVAGELILGGSLIE